MSLLELEGLHKSYGPVAALAGVDMAVAPGTRTAIVGPSGCGKTTLLRLIAGFETPDRGRIALDGKVLADAAGAVPAHLRGIGLVAQDGALFPHLYAELPLKAVVRVEPLPLGPDGRHVFPELKDQ